MNFKDLLYRILSRFLPNKFWKKHIYRRRYLELRKSQLGSILHANARLKDIHRDERCFILGNGPSLSEIDLSQLKDEITFTVNDLFYKADFDKIATTYHIFADPHYYNNLEYVLSKLQGCANLKGIFIESNGYQKMKQQNLNLKYPMYVYSNGIEVEDLGFLEIDLCKQLPYFCTVVQSAVAIAAYMGFKEIYLLGCDCSGVLNYIDRRHGEKMKHYAFDLPEDEGKKQQEIQITSEQMFFEWYHIFKSYRMLRQLFDKKEIKFINLTENSILDSLEKGNFYHVIKEEGYHSER